MNITKILFYCLVLALFSLSVLQLIPYSQNSPAMCCLTAANEQGDGEAVAEYYANSSRNYDKTLKYIQNSDFRLRNESVGANGEGSIIRVEVEQQNISTIITKVW